jgi:hypothetical protein
MAKEGFFQKIKSLLTQGSEEAIDEFAETQIADTSIQDPEVSDLPSFTYTPMIEGLAEATAEFVDSITDVGREVDHVDVRYRQEHEPYRYEPDGDKIVCVTRARLYEVNPLSGGVTIHELKPLKIKALDNCVVYSEFDTNNQGAVKDGANPKEGKYRLKVAEELPASTNFSLPDEDFDNGVDGKYHIPLFYIKDGKLSRDHWNNVGNDKEDENNDRTVQLYGGLRGHRGPFWWFTGYNAIQNLGAGKNIYQDYLQFTDVKRFRSLNEKGQSLSSPFTGNAQVNVEYNDTETEIEIYGNRYNKHWKIGGVGVGVFEDGLATCISDLDCKTLTTRELSTTSVVTATGTTSVISSGSTVTVLTSDGTTTVGGNPTASNLTSVISSVGNTNVAIAPESSDMVNVWSGGSTTNVWTGGGSAAGGGLTAFKVSKCGSTTDCVWVMGIDATGSYASSPPTFPAFITGATAQAGITGASFTSVVKSLSTTSVVNSSTATNVLKDLTPVDVISSTGTTTVLSSGSTTTVLTSGSTATVYKAHSSGTHKYLEAPSGSSADSAVKVVECPTGSDKCPTE